MSKLELYNIYAGYEESKPVLKDISFFVEKGEFIVLLGTSGCGKTTILNLIAGMIPISAGELYIDGVNLISYSETGTWNKLPCACLEK